MTAVRVAVAIILSPDRSQVLISQRAADKMHAGCWEFPGGKVEAGESAADALVRECQEEIGITVMRAKPWLVIPYKYETLTVVLDVWLVQAYDGKPKAQEGQPLAWCQINQIKNLSFPEANQGIVEALSLLSINRDQNAIIANTIF